MQNLPLPPSIPPAGAKPLLDSECYVGTQKHPPTARKLGEHTIWLCARDSIGAADIVYDLYIPLNGDLPRVRSTEPVAVMLYELVDYGGVPDDWKEFVQYVWERIQAGDKVLAWCTGSHGRTGTLYASLLALAEPDVDPVLTARERHCRKAVESVKQVEAVYALAGKPVPDSVWPAKVNHIVWDEKDFSNFSNRKGPDTTGWLALIGGFLKLHRLKGKRKDFIYEQH